MLDHVLGVTDDYGIPDDPTQPRRRLRAYHHAPAVHRARDDRYAGAKVRGAAHARAQQDCVWVRRGVVKVALVAGPLFSACLTSRQGCLGEGRKATFTLRDGQKGPSRDESWQPTAHRVLIWSALDGILNDARQKKRAWSFPLPLACGRLRRGHTWSLMLSPVTTLDHRDDTALKKGQERHPTLLRRGEGRARAGQESREREGKKQGRRAGTGKPTLEANFCCYCWRVCVRWCV